MSAISFPFSQYVKERINRVSGNFPNHNWIAFLIPSHDWLQIRIYVSAVSLCPVRDFERGELGFFRCLYKRSAEGQ